MIAPASVGREHSGPGTSLQTEMTVEAVRHTVSAKVVPLPFFNPPRKNRHARHLVTSVEELFPFFRFSVFPFFPFCLARRKIV